MIDKCGVYLIQNITYWTICCASKNSLTFFAFVPIDTIPSSVSHTQSRIKNNGGPRQATRIGPPLQAGTNCDPRTPAGPRTNIIFVEHVAISDWLA